MDDLIIRKAAIDAFLTELTRRERNNLLHTWSTVEVKYFITKMLENLPSAQPERKWVPVREELPREYGLYLVTTCKGNVYLWTYKPEMKEIWIHFVTAWCYLPEPHEE